MISISLAWKYVLLNMNLQRFILNRILIISYLDVHISVNRLLELSWVTRVYFSCVTDLAYTNMFRQEGVTTYSQLLFDVARQQVVVGARYVLYFRRKSAFNYYRLSLSSGRPQLLRIKILQL